MVYFHYSVKIKNIPIIRGCCEMYITVYLNGQRLWPSVLKKNTTIVIVVSLKVMRQRLFFAWNESALVYAPLVQPDFIFNTRYAMEAEETAWMSNKRRIKREDGERGIPISLKFLFPLLLSFSHSSLFSISHLSVGQSSEYWTNITREWTSEAERLIAEVIEEMGREQNDKWAGVRPGKRT